MSAVSELYELTQKTRLSRPVFKFYTKYRCVVTVAEIGKAEGFGYDEKTSKRDAAKNLLQTEVAEKYKKLCQNNYSWTNVDDKAKHVVCKLLVSHADALAALLLHNDSNELQNHCNAICTKLGVLLADFE